MTLSARILCSLALWLVCSCQPSPTQQPTLVIAVAANMQVAAESLAEVFSSQTGIRCEVTAGSSGSLAAQIREGAPYDVFLSADMHAPQALFEEGFATEPPIIYARGRLVLWTLTEGLDPSLELLTSDAIRHLALANPRTAPYGTAAMEVLTRHGLAEQVKEKLVFGESISQTNQFILSGSAEIGFTALSTVLAPAMQNQGKWVEMDSSWHTPMRQGIIWLNRDSTRAEAARKFAGFVTSTEAAGILRGFGYLTGE